jgi:RNase P/RNase MRP subunit p29
MPISYITEPTNQMYVIYTLEDIKKIPKTRRRAFLIEFEIWLETFGESTEVDGMVWFDDGRPVLDPTIVPDGV